MSITLRDYPLDVNAALISASEAYTGLVTILNVNNVDVTQTLISNRILVFVGRLPHGYVNNVDAATKFTVEHKYYAMSSQFNAGETPIFFARVINSYTRNALTTADVSSITFGLYTFASNNIRSSAGVGYAEVEGWTNISLTVSDVMVDNPTEDPRCDFLANLSYEPNTRENNPFTEPGNYRAIFNIVPVNGNKIPIVFNFRVS